MPVAGLAGAPSVASRAAAVELALLDEPVELLLDLADAHLREVGRRVDDDHVEPGLRGDLGDALPHLAGADHAELLDLAFTARSTSSAMPSPPPMHSDAPPVFAFFAAIAWSSVTRMRAPEAPIGWPSATAPPQMFTFAGSRPSIWLFASDTTANASLISQRSTFLASHFAFSSAFLIAGAGAVVNHSGACAW